MKQKKISRIIVCALVTTIFTGSMPLQHTQAFASTTEIENNSTIKIENNQNKLTIDELTSNKTNVVMLDNSLNHTEYTYEKDGKSYKAVESINNSFDKGSTKIFQKNDNDGSYDLICTTLLNVDNGSIKLKTTAIDGQIVNEEFKLDDLIENFNINKNYDTSLLTPENINNPRSSSLTSWQFSTEFSSSTKIKRYTTTFVTAALTAVLSYYFGSSAAAQATIAGLGAVVGIVVSDEIPLVYYDQNVFYKYILNTDPPLPRAEKTDTWFFSDYSRNQPLGGKVSSEYYVPGWS